MLTGLTLPQVALLLACGVLLDLLLGEARRWHPLVGFGNLAKRIEGALNHGGSRFVRGTAAWALAVLPLSALALWACGHAGLALHAALLYFCIGFRSLRDHNLPIADALARGDLAQARELTARIVSRDTATASEGDLAKASAESLLENGNDAVFGTLFWFIVAGGPGAVLFRLANTLDAMWGYRSTRFLQFGWAAARIDDVLNYLPARLTALSYVLLAGALGLALGGSASYDGVAEQRPPLGAGAAADAGDILRAWKLVAATTGLWVALAGAAGLAVLGAAHA